jgi:hypothetical protein
MDLDFRKFSTDGSTNGSTCKGGLVLQVGKQRADTKNVSTGTKKTRFLRGARGGQNSSKVGHVWTEFTYLHLVELGGIGQVRVIGWYTRSLHSSNHQFGRFQRRLTLEVTTDTGEPIQTPGLTNTSRTGPRGNRSGKRLGNKQASTTTRRGRGLIRVCTLTELAELNKGVSKVLRPEFCREGIRTGAETVDMEENPLIRFLEMAPNLGMDQAKSHLKNMVNTRDMASTIHEIAMLKNPSTERCHGLAITLWHQCGHRQGQAWLTVWVTSHLKHKEQSVETSQGG